MKRAAPKDPALLARAHNLVVYSPVQLDDEDARLLGRIVQAAANGWPLTAHESARLAAIEERAVEHGRKVAEVAGSQP